MSESTDNTSQYLEAVETVVATMTPAQIRDNLENNPDLNEAERSVLREAARRKG